MSPLQSAMETVEGRLLDDSFRIDPKFVRA